MVAFTQPQNNDRKIEMIFGPFWAEEISDDELQEAKFIAEQISNKCQECGGGSGLRICTSEVDGIEGLECRADPTGVGVEVVVLLTPKNPDEGPETVQKYMEIVEMIAKELATFIECLQIADDEDLLDTPE